MRARSVFILKSKISSSGSTQSRSFLDRAGDNDMGDRNVATGIMLVDRSRSLQFLSGVIVPWINTQLVA